MSKIIFAIFLMPILLLSNPNIDSLKVVLKNTKSVEKVKILNKISENFLNIDTDSALYYAKKSFTLTKFFNSETLSATSAFLIGKAYIEKEDYESALEYSKYSMEIFRDNNNIDKYMLSLINMGAIYCALSDYNNSLAYYKILLSISKTNNKKELYAIALDGMGTIYYLEGESELALRYFKSALLEFENVKGEDNRARILYLIAAVKLTTSKYDQALDYLIASIKIAEEKENIEYLAYDYHAIGVIYQELKNYSMAIKYNNMALKIAEKINYKYLIGNFLSHLGEIYLQLVNIDTATVFANKALEFQKEIKNKVGIARALILLGDIHQNNNKYQKAQENYIKAWNVIKNIDHKYWQIRILNHLGAIYAKMGKNNFAKKYLIKSLNDAKKIGAQDLVQDNLNALADYYARLHDYKKAYQYLMEFTHLSDSIFTTSSNNIAEMQMRYETGKREKENELLKSKLDIQNLELDKSNLKYWLSSLSLIIVSIIGFFSYYRYNVKKKANILLEKRIKNALYKQQEQQEIIFHQANLSSLGELSAGMAHEINQPLQGIKLSTEALDLDIQSLIEENSDLKENIVEIYQGVDRIKNIIDHVRIFASQQKNHIDEYFSISTVIENALSLVGKQYLKIGILVRMKLDERIDRIKGNPFKYEQVVFNLLSNAKDALLEKETNMNQSFDKEINLRTYRDEADIVFEVQDNGIGMTVKQKDNIFNPFFTTKNLGVGTGLGLSIVFGIVKEMKGKIQVESEYNSGTTVYIRIPSAA